MNDGNGRAFGTTEFKYMPYAKSAGHAAMADDVGQLTKLGVGDTPTGAETVSPAGHYTVVAIKSYTTLPRFVTVLQNSGYFDVYIRDLSGNLVNGGFNFVVFKK